MLIKEPNPDPSCSLASSLTTTLRRSLVGEEIISRSLSNGL